MRVAALIGAAVLAIGTMGCATLADVAGYTKTADIPPPPRDYAAEMKDPKNFANFQGGGPGKPGLLRVNLQSCTAVEGDNDEVAYYDCEMAAPPPPPVTPPAPEAAE